MEWRVRLQESEPTYREDRLYLSLTETCRLIDFTFHPFDITAIELLLLSYLFSVELGSLWNCRFKISIFVYDGFVISARKSPLIVFTNDFIFLF